MKKNAMPVQSALDYANALYESCNRELAPIWKPESWNTVPRHDLVTLGWMPSASKWISPYFGSLMSEREAQQMEANIDTLGMSRLKSSPLEL